MTVALLLARDLQLRPPGGTTSPLSPRDALMLAWLALEGPTPRHRLAHLLWPESDSAAAHNALRQRIFKLRKLGGSDIVVGRTMLSLAAHVEHDLASGSPVLGDADHRFAGELAAWLEQRREHWLQQRRKTLVERFEAARSDADADASITLANELLALEPLSEEAHRRVMQVHYLHGDRPLALLAFDRCEKLLKDEVGVAPSAQTLALLQAIERSAEPAVPAGAVANGAGPPRLPATVLRPPLRIGRAAVWQALTDARDGRGVLLLAGEAGLGKSRLLVDLAQTAAGLAPRTLLMSARPGDAAVPYALLARGLRSLLQAFSLAPDPADRDELARLVPEHGAARPMRHDDDSALLAEALHRQLAAAADSGLQAVAVDDLQFADDASVEMLQRVMADSRVAWLIAYRPAELSAASRTMVEGLQRRADVASVRLEPWSREETIALLDSLAIDTVGGAAQAESLHRHTGGNPLYVLETLKAAITARSSIAVGAAASGEKVHWPAAPNVARLIEQRLMLLSPLAVQVARCAAVAGPDAGSALIAAVLGLRPLDLVDAWLELERGQIFIAGHFAHDLIAEAALGSVPEAIARTLHGDIAGWLERAGGEPARIADHWIAAGQPARAGPHLCAAALVALNAWRLGQAADLYDQAGQLLRAAGDRRAAFDAYLAAADAYSESKADERLVSFRDSLQALADEPGQRAWVDLLDVALLVEARRFDEAMALTDAAVSRLDDTSDGEVMSELLWGVAVIRWERRETDLAVAAAEQALAALALAAPARRRLASTELRLTQALGIFACNSGRFEAGARYLHAARAVAIDRGDRHELARIDGQLACAAIDQGDLPRALVLAPGAVAERLDGPHFSTARVTEMQFRARIAVASGELGTALALYDEMAPFCEGGGGRSTVLPLIRRARLHHLLGRRDLAAAGLGGLQRRADLLDVDRAYLNAARVALEGARLPDDLLERAGRIDDFSTRIDVLCLVLPEAAPDLAEPLLAAAQASASNAGAHGLWLMLQAGRVAMYSRAGSGGEAAEAALAAWQRIEAGLLCAQPLPAVASALCAALRPRHGAIAREIAERALAWMQAAAATLPAAWRDNYLARAPALDGLRG